ncbi:ORF08R [Marbled eel polyomavirus]|uniref:LO5 n=1 Tax=Anguilla marmorata adomavirus 1 TaxID=2175116 RepID=A0A2S1MK46_9VIRU|nr:ORF08R [Marbled eel polyomavirus]ANC70197.1 ORF08R [Marbled eel polyomavirus]AOY07800.1 LO5 [Marbled eel polyomavirus]AWG87416.1 LO5 [Anguilla marmorata adomavirus 1]
MELGGTHFQDYHIIRPGEVARDVYVLFNDNDGQSYAECKFDHPFIIHLGANGRRNIGIGLTQVTVSNTPKNISAKNNNSHIFLAEANQEPDQYQRSDLRDGFYDSAMQIVQELQETDPAIRFQFDHLGVASYIGPKDMLCPILLPHGKLIPDNFCAKFGFTVEEGALERIGDIMYRRILPGSKAEGPGDLFGPVADMCVSCDECIYTKETDRVLGVFPLAASASRAYVPWYPRYKPRCLIEMAELTVLHLHLKDRFNRDLEFVSGTPSATIEIKHLS